MHKTANCIGNTVPTFSPVAALTFVANQLRQVLADDPARCDELQETWIAPKGDAVSVPIDVFENWRNMLEAAAEGFRAADLRDKRPAKPERCECRDTEDGGAELVMDLSGR